MAASADIGVIGLGVMGRNLALNIADRGFTVAVYNRTVATTRAATAWMRSTSATLVPPYF